jgi:hypothetical protein
LHYEKSADCSDPSPSAVLPFLYDQFPPTLVHCTTAVSFREPEPEALATLTLEGVRHAL